MPLRQTPTDYLPASPALAAITGCLLSFARGLVLVMVMVLPMVMLKRLGLGNSWAAFDTALMLLPFVVRGVLRPAVEGWRHRWWMLPLIQLVLAVAVWGAAESISPRLGIGLWLWLALFSVAGAVHDVMAADLTALWCEQWGRQRRVQLCLVFGILASVLGMGVTLVLAGDMEVLSRKLDEAWHIALTLMAAMLAAVAAVDFFALPRDEKSQQPPWRVVWQGCMKAHAQWWSHPKRWQEALAVVLLSLHQWMLWRGTFLFLIDPGSIGGLSLGPQGIGFAQGTIGALALMTGTVMGVGAIGKSGLRRWLWPMTLAVTLPDGLLLYLSYEMPSDLLTVSTCLLVENLLCGFGMVGILHLLFRGTDQDDSQVHADNCLALLALAAMVAGLVSGFLLDMVGYRRFFLIVVAASMVAVLTMAWLDRKYKV